MEVATSLSEETERTPFDTSVPGASTAFPHSLGSKSTLSTPYSSKLREQELEKAFEASKRENILPLPYCPFFLFPSCHSCCYWTHSDPKFSLTPFFYRISPFTCKIEEETPIFVGWKRDDALAANSLHLQHHLPKHIHVRLIGTDISLIFPFVSCCSLTPP